MAGSKYLLRVGLNYSVKGKIKTGQSFESLAKNWQTKEISLDDLAGHICKGYAWMPGQLKPGTRRKNENVDRAEVLAIDIDHGMTIAEALQHPIISEWASLGVTSASHSEAEHKFRLVFRLPAAIEGEEAIKAANRLLIGAIGTADKACKDAARFFFGATNAEVFLQQEVCLPEDWQEQFSFLAAGEEEEEAGAEEERGDQVAVALVLPQLGTSSLVDFLDKDIYPRLSPEQLYNWTGHKWATKTDSKMRGCCPFHDSQSGTAFYIDYKGGKWLWNCPSCDIGGSPVEYRYALRGGKGSPKGKEFVEICKELAQEAGVAMPEMPRELRVGTVGDSAGVAGSAGAAPVRERKPESPILTALRSEFEGLSDADKNKAMFEYPYKLLSKLKAGILTADVVVDHIKALIVYAHDNLESVKQTALWREIASKKIGFNLKQTEDLADALFWQSEKGQAAEARKSALRLEGYWDIGLKGENDRLIDARLDIKADFDFEIIRVLNSVSGDGGGYMMRVYRRRAGKRLVNDVFIASTATSKVSEFNDALKRAIGAPITAAYSLPELQATLSNKELEYRRKVEQEFYRIDRVGQQGDGTWVFDGIQYTSTGATVTDTETGWVWSRDLSSDTAIPSPKMKHGDGLESLKELAAALREVVEEEPAYQLRLFSLGWFIAHVHYQSVMNHKGFFPTANFSGDPGGFKTKALELGMSLFGLHNNGIINRFSESLAYEMSKHLGSIPLAIDDPINKGSKNDVKASLEAVLQNFYNAAPRQVRGNRQEPRSSVIVTTNQAIADDNTAALSRMFRVHFSVTTFNRRAFNRLSQAMDNASKGLPILIAMGYDESAVSDMEAIVMERLPHSHSRVAFTLALVSHYVEKFCQLTGVAFDAKAYCLERICPEFDSAETGKDSLTDFLEKLAALRSAGKVGEWNAAQVDRDGKQYLAVYLPELWQVFQKEFEPNYTKSTIESLAEEAGGARNITQRFVSDMQTWKQYQQALNQYRMLHGTEDAYFNSEKNEKFEPPHAPRRDKTKRCLLVPMDRVTSIWAELQDAIKKVTPQTAGISSDLPLELHQSHLLLKNNNNNSQNSGYIDQAQTQDFIEGHVISSHKGDFSNSTPQSLDTQGSEGFQSDVTPDSVLLENQVTSPESQIQHLIATEIPACQTWAQFEDLGIRYPQEVKQAAWDALKNTKEGRLLRKRITALKKHAAKSQGS